MIARADTLCSVASAVILAALTSPMAAFAQGPGEEADITGEWAFEAGGSHPACRIFGEASIRPGDEPGQYLCTFVANDVCPTLWAVAAQQTCVAKRDGDQLVIESRVVSVDPPSSYAPDDFELTIIDGALMQGELKSLIETEAVFRRTDIPIG